jgi:hypothetical protein
LAFDTHQQENVCVKIFKKMDKETEKTFHAEVQAGQTGMNHKNVLRLLGAGRSSIMKNG